MKAFRYLAAVLPLLGLALTGCSGLLGAVDGTGDVVDDGTRITIVGQATVEGAVLGGGAGNVNLANAQVRLVRRISPTEVVQVGLVTTTDANGNFTIGPFQVTAAELDDIWEIQVIGSAGGAPVFVSKALVPRSVAGSSTPASIASTIVAASLAQGARQGEAGTFSQADIDRTVAAIATSLSGVGIAAFRPSSSDFATFDLVALYNAIRNAGAAAINAAVASVRFRTADNQATQGFVTVQQGASGVVIAEPLDPSGNVLALGVAFSSVTGGSGISATPISANQVQITATATASGQGTLTATVGNKTAALLIKVVTIHQQAHIQGGSSSLPLP